MSLPRNVDNAIRTLPPSLQPATVRWFERLCGEHSLPDGIDTAKLARVVAASEFAAEVLRRHWSELSGDIARLDAPPDLDALRAFVDALVQSDADVAAIKAALRQERNRQLLHVAWRDVTGASDVDESLATLSAVADALIDAACRCAARQIQERHGVVRDGDGNAVPLVVIAMGKLGGGELNFSSDIDVIFAYPRDGESDGPKSLHAQPYFDRLSRHVVALLDEVTEDGFVYRTDTRLRPFGDSGPPVVSFAALESYLLQHGRDWERYAYVKARVVCTQPAEDVGGALFDNLVVPFVYRRYLDYGVFESLREMHAMIAAEVQRRELSNNVKLGPGGIREIEFIVQSLQLVRGGRHPELQSPSLLQTLPLLVDGKSLDAAAAESLAAAYRFLRRLENAIQALRDKQTHDLPDNETDRARLCVALGFDDWESLAASWQRHCDAVSAQFDRLAFHGTRDDDGGTLRSRVEKLWEAEADVDDWRQLLDSEGFDEAEAVAKAVAGFRHAPETQKIDAASAERLHRFVPRLLRLAKECERPLLAVERSLSVLTQILRRSAYLSLLNENRLAAERLVRLCERSAYIAAELARFPALLDELLDPQLLSGPMSRAELDAELRDRLARQNADDSEAHMEVLVQFQRGNLFRVAVADFSGKLPIMKVSDSLTFLAESVLEHALRVAWDDVAAKTGAPTYSVDGRRHEAGFGIIAYGKLGGLELSYGSDLDIVFLHDSRGSEQVTNGKRPVDNAIFFTRLVRRLMHFLTTQTSTGALYEIDTRLRPSGRKGLLVTSLDAFERYQEENAWTWEHQALLRARPVAGSAAVAQEFDRIRDETLRRRVRLDALRDDVLSMRERMRAELDKSDDGHFDLKHGQGGIGDIEFIVQYLVLRHAREHAAVIEYSDNIRQLDALAACGAVTAETASRLQDIYRAYRLCLHHRVLNDERGIVPAAELRRERDEVVAAWNGVFGS